MELSEFAINIEIARKNHPIWFELMSNRNITVKDITAVEEKLGIALPSDYKVFVERYGGGMVAFVKIYTLEELIEQNSSINCPSLLVVSDNGAGDLLGYKIDTEDRTIYLYEHDERRLVGKYSDLFSYICSVGLTP